jgi:hypothetical protein
VVHEVILRMVCRPIQQKQATLLIHVLMMLLYNIYVIGICTCNIGSYLLDDGITCDTCPTGNVQMLLLYQC